MSDDKKMDENARKAAEAEDAVADMGETDAPVDRMMDDPKSVPPESLAPELEAALEDEAREEEIDEEAAAEPTPEEIIAALEADRDSFRDKWTRALAEAENVRRRAERDKKDASTYGGTRLARDLLVVYDNLDRALKAADETLREQHKAFFEGVELTQRELLNAFSKHNIEPVEPEPGEKFDPNMHQAMFEAPVEGTEPGHIIECVQSGFRIADRLLRPAMVGVARKADG